MPDWEELRCQYSALYYKNVIVLKRSIKMSVIEIGITFFCASAFLLLKLITRTKQFPPVSLNYGIQETFTYMPDTLALRAMVNVNWTKNAYTGLTPTQLVVAQLYLNYWLGQPGNLTHNPRLLVKTQMMPAVTIGVENLSDILIVLPTIMLSLVVISTLLIVEEKEANIKETLKVQGLSQVVYWSSWLLARLFIGLINVLIVSLLWSYEWKRGPMFHLSFVSQFTLYTHMTINSLTFSLMLSCFLNDAKLAGLYAFFYFVAANVLSNQVSGSWINVLVGPFLYSHGMIMCFKWLCAEEFRYFRHEKTDADVLPFVEGMLYMVLNSAVNCTIVLASERLRFREAIRCEIKKTCIPPVPPQNKKFFEKPSGTETTGIVVRDLVKMYDKAMVVSGVSLDIYTNQITMLLGHNGAGKTTMISMILGLTPITRGQVMIDGMDVIGNMTAIRKTLGFCPQHDLFFPRLTVYEHMVFYTKMRKGELTRTGALETLSQLELQLKIDDKPKNLSGGQKRKLSVACAFVGNTKTIFLDEPSTGLDPSSRRDLWRCLTNLRQGRTLLMTTHFMDEADYLSDRIAIMANGVVKCCGTPMFLKKIYGIGYKLTLVKSAECHEYKVIQHVLSSVQAAIYQSSNISEITFLLPDNCVSEFPKLLQSLDKKMASLNLQSYGLSATTMEDVFLRVGEISESKQDSQTETFSQKIEQKAPIDIPSSLQVEKKDSQKSSKTKNQRNSVELKSIVVEVGNSNVDPTPTQSLRQTTTSQSLRQTTTSQSLRQTTTSQSASQNLSTNPGDMPDTADNDVVDKEQGDVIEARPESIDEKNKGRQLKANQFRALLIKRWILTKRSWVTLASILALNLFATLVFVALTYNSELDLPMDFKLSDYKNITIVVGKPSDNNSVAIYHGLISLLPPDVRVVEPNRSLSFDDFLKGWIRTNGFSRYREEIMMGFEINEPPSPSIVHYQGFYVHSEPVAVDVFLNAHIQALLGSNYSLQSGVYPYTEYDQNILYQGFSLLLILGALFSLHTVIVGWLIRERISGARQLETITGVPIWVSWLANYLFDMCLQLVIAAIFWIAILCQKSTQELIVHLPMIIWTQLLFMLDVLPYCYLFQMYFKRSSNAVFSLMAFQLIVQTLYVKMTSLNENKPISSFVNFALHVLMISSPYTKYLDIVSLLEPTHQESFKVAKEIALYISLHALGTWSLLLAIEYFNVKEISFQSLNDCRRSEFLPVEKVTAESDDDVSNEQNRILNTDLKQLFLTDALILVKVCKHYYKFSKALTAVDNTCLGIPKNECFGLLGQNGAGKTTTFKILTGECESTSGDVYFNGLSLDTNLSKIHQMMGYCPQDDYLHDDLTGRESLYLFGRLRGVPEKSLPGVTDYLISAVLLDLHADKETKKYSLGSKRKLSTALAVIGDPQFVMLDEPTSGMDAMAKRAIWDLLQNVRSLGSTLVLTSHSMEECELLCTRLTIMVGGKLMCLGSPQHLKTKYAQGYTITVHLKPDSGVPIQGIIDNLLKIFSGAQVFGQMDTYLHLQIPADSLPLSSMFKMMEKAKKDMNFEHYTIQQTSLEQVFLMFMNKNKTTGC
ncbi:phospholipid-transporting ATPase ABCA3-like [Physella acuta]|uniref:phospholipid-transporting ATPase ABCA3-like n=1 Tax=Physella acuta TaxID=109671 RepID=UPI0027DCA30B|nr:phospholipid-transporting ATPase ABCA3-like [Physella acuta]